MRALKSVSISKVLTSIVVIFMLSLVTLLSSCTATVRTPRHVRTEVVIQGQVSGGHQDGDDRQERRRQRQERREHHDND